MPRTRTSKAVIKTARINPLNAPEERALKYINDLEAQGYNFKQIIVDAINYRAGATPEMFTHENDRESARFARVVEQIFGEFAQEMMEKINSGAITVSSSPAEDEQRSDGLSAFARNFSKGVIQRQQITTGDNDEA